MHLILTDTTNSFFLSIQTQGMKYSLYKQNISIQISINYILVKIHGTLLLMVLLKESVFLSVMELTEHLHLKIYMKMI